VESLYVPVSNPYFMDFLSVRETKAKGVLYKILNYIGPIRLEGKKIIDCSQYEGYFARITKRMCASEVIHYSFEWQQKEIAEKIAGVLHVQNINFEMLSCLDIEIIRTADMIFAMQNIDKLLDGNLFDGYKGILFIEMSVDKRQQFLDKIKEKTHLINYQYLHREVVNGELLEVGVFS